MTQCPSCGSEMDFIEEYDQWYCGSCQQYQDVHPQDTPRPPPPPPSGGGTSSRGPMIIAGVVVIILIIAAALFFLVLGPDDDDTKSKTVNMNMADLEEDLVVDENGVNFKSLEPGDTLVIEDEIVYIATDDYWGETVTYVWFESAHEEESINDWRYYYYYDDEYAYFDYDLVFQGDLTDDYHQGDTVKVTLHVIDLSNYGDYGDYKGDGYSGSSGYTIEAFAENWDDGEFQHLPKSCIKLLSSDYDDDDDEIAGGFPSLEVKFYDMGDESQDKIVIKHIQGDPLRWSDFKIIIRNNTNDDSIALSNLNPITPNQITSGESTTIDSSILSTFTMDLQKSKAYTLEIYNLKENKRVWVDENIICK